jgi:hypothetical protein
VRSWTKSNNGNKRFAREMYVGRAGKERDSSHIHARIMQLIEKLYFHWRSWQCMGCNSSNASQAHEHLVGALSIEMKLASGQLLQLTKQTFCRLHSITNADSHQMRLSPKLRVFLMYETVTPICFNGTTVDS